MAPKTKCGNPLFLKWTEEIRDAAREKGSKSAETYSWACKSIALCPVTYARPRDLVCLKSVGDKTVSQLEKRWAEYCKANGKEVPPEPEKPAPKTTKAKDKARAAPDDDDGLDEPPKKARKAPAPKTPKASKAYIPNQGTGAYAILMALVLAIDQPQVTTEVFLTKSEIIRTAQEYCDVSFEHSERGTYYTAWSGMKTLVSKGYVYVTGNPHKHCLTEEGYDVAVAIRNIRPEFSHLKRYPFLPTSAANVAQPIAQAQDTPRNRPLSARDLYIGPSSLPNGMTTAYVPQTKTHSSPASRLGDFNAVATKVAASSGDRFHFWYICPSNKRVKAMTQAHMRLDPETFVSLRRIEFRYAQRNHALVASLRLVDDFAKATLRDTSGKPTLFGYILETDAPPQCSAPLEESEPKNRPPSRDSVPPLGSSPLSASLPRPRMSLTGSREASFVDLADGDRVTKKRPAAEPFPLEAQLRALRKQQSSGSLTEADLARPAPSRRPNPYEALLNQGPGMSSTLARTSAVGGAQPRTSSLSALNAGPASHATAGPSRSRSSAPLLPSRPTDAPWANVRPSNNASVPMVPPGFEDDIVPPVDPPPASIPSFTLSDAIVFPPGSFDIILVVDTREVESKTSRDMIWETLQQKGLRVETRALKLGDMCWVARRKDGLGGEEDECVLDYVVERKRLDDLVTSIKDGRYTEQCFRLQNACIGHVYYIVENFKKAEMEHSALAIMTCKSQLQVHNRFFMKETNRLLDSIDFLATMTNVIKSSCRNKPLHVIPSRYLSRPTYKPLQEHLKIAHPNLTFHTSFDAYQSLNTKSACVTLKETLARMLMRVKGMSAEKVSALLDQWDTPRGLWEAMKMRNEMPDEMEAPPGTGKGKKKKTGKGLFFAQATAHEESRRKIGDALSENLWRALMG
ncbi:hypothetical protein I350_01467 [Cryptococcus amylolentus CBS 6273]|uniref:Crossover junction endonuclease MUS81 n=1 Tax=Cryptococcus amylolentus CBS 6273 TaxID=1296118 RepID=A0A1E3KCP3_9TREE|nr:hypothetical protein I350_01467 [Cryptococcus amylolentus CBS 6273]